MDEKHNKHLKYCKQYYQENRNKLLTYGCEQVKCELCDFVTGRTNLKRHQRSKFCRRINEIKQDLKNNPIV